MSILLNVGMGFTTQVGITAQNVFHTVSNVLTKMGFVFSAYQLLHLIITNAVVTLIRKSSILTQQTRVVLT